MGRPRSIHENWERVNAILKNESDMDSSDYGNSSSEDSDSESDVEYRAQIKRSKSNGRKVGGKVGIFSYVPKHYLPLVITEAITVILTALMAVQITTYKNPNQAFIDHYLNQDDYLWYPVLATIVAGLSITLPVSLLRTRNPDSIGWAILTKFLCAGLFIGTFIYETNQPYGSSSIWGLVKVAADVTGADRGRQRTGWMIALAILQFVEIAYLYFGLFVTREVLFGQEVKWFDRDGADKYGTTSSRRSKKSSKRKSSKRTSTTNNRDEERKRSSKRGKSSSNKRSSKSSSSSRRRSSRGSSRDRRTGTYYQPNSAAILV